MVQTPRAQSNNRLVKHKAYPKIMAEYNEILHRDGKVVEKTFYEKFVRPEIPSYSLDGWYNFIKRFKTSEGLTVPRQIAGGHFHPPTARTEVEEQTAIVMLSNNDAVQRSIAHALNISAAALQDILQNPELVPAEKRAELFIKVMKAQDSRVKAIGTIRADNRDQERFDRAMDNAAYY